MPLPTIIVGRCRPNNRSLYPMALLGYAITGGDVLPLQVSSKRQDAICAFLPRDLGNWRVSFCSIRLASMLPIYTFFGYTKIYVYTFLGDFWLARFDFSLISYWVRYGRPSPLKWTGPKMRNQSHLINGNAKEGASEQGRSRDLRVYHSS